MWIQRKLSHELQKGLERKSKIYVKYLPSEVICYYSFCLCSSARMQHIIFSMLQLISHLVFRPSRTMFFLRQNNFDDDIVDLSMEALVNRLASKTRSNSPTKIPSIEKF